MKCKLVFYLMLFCLLISNSGNARQFQNKSHMIQWGAVTNGSEEKCIIQPLRISDTIPEKFWNYTVELASNNSLRLSELKGKVILLDFLSTGCSGCIAALPRLHTIQQQYDGQLIVLPITPESRERVGKFIPNNPNTRNLDLPFVVEDKLLKQYFPHQYISHVVWIDTSGVVRATTGTSHVTDRTVREFMTGNPLDWPMKMENTTFFNEPLVALGAASNKIPNNAKRSLYYSAITGYTEGIGPLTPSADSLKGIEWTSYRNRTALDLYLIAVNRLYKLSTSQQILEVSQPNRFRWRPGNGQLTIDEWYQRNAICYEATFPISTAREKRNEYMLADLNRFLNLNGRLVNRDTVCLALTRVDSSINLAYHGRERINNLLETGISKQLTGYSLSHLIDALNDEQFKCQLVLDETGFEKPVDIRLRIENLGDLTVLRNALNEYGLDLVEVHREVEFFVLTEL